jgi:DNA-binding MarR family transcriptional regulator
MNPELLKQPEKIQSTKAEMEELFLRKKPVHLLICIKALNVPGAPQQKYISLLSKETDCTYSHTVKLLESFRRLGLVEFEKLGRVKYIQLTKEGEELAHRFDEVLKLFSKTRIKKPALETQKEAKKSTQTNQKTQQEQQKQTPPKQALPGKK